MTASESTGRTVALEAACVTMVIGGLGALTNAVQPGRWLLVAAVAVGLTAVLTAALRRGMRGRATPTAVGLLVAALGIVFAYGGPGGGSRLLLDGRTLTRLADTAVEAISQANASFPPMAASRAIEMLLVGGAVILYLVIELVAVGLHAPAWSGLLPVTLWLPATLLVLPTPVWGFVVTAAGYLALLAISATSSSASTTTRPERRRLASITARYIAVVAGATLLVTPLLVQLPGWGSVTLPTFGTSVGGPVRLSADLDLRADLGGRSGQVILTYTTDKAAVGPLRVFTMSDFDGRSWAHPDDSVPAFRSIEPDALLAPVGSPAATGAPTATGSPSATGSPGAGAPDTTTAHVEVTIKMLQDVHLPITITARTLQIDGRWSYDATRDEVVGRRPTTSGMTYTMTAQVPSWTPAELAAAGAGSPDAMARNLAVPRTDRTDAIRQAAREVIGDADTNYARAVALQKYFRDSRNFTYDTSVPTAVSEDAVWDFLQERRGYCVHFATAMVMMARTLGIPARIAVGFLPGPAAGDSYTVSGKQVHAWPELYFEGAGWVRFEPTPAIQTGAAPTWTDPANAPAPTASPSSEKNNSPATPLPTATSGPVSNRAGGATSTGAAPWWWILGAGVLLSIVGSGVIVQRLRTRSPELDPERAWVRLRRRLAKAGVRWEDSSTPRAVVEIVRDQVLVASGMNLDAEADAALVTLARAVEDLRYAPVPRARRGDELEPLLQTVIAAVTRAVTARPARADDPSGPPTAP
jgi:transglutaminase-like putative cysteine protease